MHPGGTSGAAHAAASSHIASRSWCAPMQHWRRLDQLQTRGGGTPPAPVLSSDNRAAAAVATVQGGTGEAGAVAEPAPGLCDRGADTTDQLGARVQTQMARRQR